MDIKGKRRRPAYRLKLAIDDRMAPFTVRPKVGDVWTVDGRCYSLTCVRRHRGMLTLWGTGQ